MRRLRSRLFVLIVLALLGYSAWQMVTLKREVADLRAEVAVLKADSLANSSDESKESALIGDAYDHIDRAKKHMLRGDLDKAKSELDKSLQLVQKAGKDLGGPSSQAIRKIQDTLQDARSSIERLWRDMDGSVDNVKGG